MNCPVKDEIAAAGPVHARAAGEPLLVIVDESAREAGLGASLSGSGSSDGGLSVELHQAPFDTLVAWLARLGEQNGVQVETADIHSAGVAGLVNASIVLKAP